MNPRMPYYPQQVPSSEYHHNGYVTPHSWNDMRPESSMSSSSNWKRNNRNSWKMNRNWQPKYNRESQQPYAVPKKPFNPRFQRNRYDNGPTNNYYENNGHQSNWVQTQRTKPIKSPDEKGSEQSIPGTIANKKKRKPMSKSYPSNKWDEKDAEKALQAEKDFAKNLKNQSLMIRFPDPNLSKEIVKEFHPKIESVHFPQASTPRYCFAHLEETADINKVVAALEKIPFGQGFLSVDIRKAREENIEVSPKDIDPYTLYVGNLPLNVTKQGAIQKFPGCIRIDIGHPQQMKNTRYAFVRFGNVDDAIKAYRTTRNVQFESRSLIVRFRRINGNVGVPGETKQPNIPKSESPPSTSISSLINSPDTHSMATSISSIPSCSSMSEAPDLNLVKKEPTSDNEDDYRDIKPDLSSLNGIDASIKTEIKAEPQSGTLANEDDVDHSEEEEEYLHDTFQYTEGNVQEECDDYEDEDDFDDEEDPGLDLDLNDTFLPDDDDEDLFNGDG